MFVSTIRIRDQGSGCPGKGGGFTWSEKCFQERFWDLGLHIEYNITLTQFPDAMGLGPIALGTRSGTPTSLSRIRSLTRTIQYCSISSMEPIFPDPVPEAFLGPWKRVLMSMKKICICCCLHWYSTFELLML